MSFFDKKKSGIITADELSKWINAGVVELGNGEAYCFNLYEDEKAWTCEFISTNSIDREDEDWVCDEKSVYSRENPITICTKKDIDDFEKVLAIMLELLKECLMLSKDFKALADKKTIAYGFVDGDVEYLN